VLGKPGSKYPKATVKWHVSAQSADRAVDGVTKEISPRQAYIQCSKPFRLNEVVDVVITTPERHLQFNAEVVWSNMYGYDDEITPRGMGLRFVEISDEDRKYIGGFLKKDYEIEKAAFEYLNTLITEIDEN
jgi:hypothetical protein